MSLYEQGRRVWHKGYRRLGTVEGADYQGPIREFTKDRRAHYYVTLDATKDDWAREVECGSADLRAADWECDICGRYLPGSPYAVSQVVAFGEVDDTFHFCFLCAGPPAERIEARTRDAIEREHHGIG